MITKKFGIDFDSNNGALTLPPEYVFEGDNYQIGESTRTHNNGWTITGYIKVLIPIGKKKMTNLLRWARKEDGSLFLEVNEEGKWLSSYTQSRYYEVDTIAKGLKLSKGYRTAQNCLAQGYKYVQSGEKK